MPGHGRRRRGPQARAVEVGEVGEAGREARRADRRRSSGWRPVRLRWSLITTGRAGAVRRARAIRRRSSAAPPGSPRAPPSAPRGRPCATGWSSYRCARPARTSTGTPPTSTECAMPGVALHRGRGEARQLGHRHARPRLAQDRRPPRPSPSPSTTAAAMVAEALADRVGAGAGDGVGVAGSRADHGRPEPRGGRAGVTRRRRRMV